MKASQPYLQFYDTTEFSMSLSHVTTTAGTSGGVLEELDDGAARRLRLRLALFSLPCWSHTALELSVAAGASCIWRSKRWPEGKGAGRATEI